MERRWEGEKKRERESERKEKKILWSKGWSEDEGKEKMMGGKTVSSLSIYIIF